MATFTSTTSNPTSTISHLLNPQFNHLSQFVLPLSIPISNPRKSHRLFCCFAAAKQQSGPVKKRPPSSPTNRRKKKKNSKSDFDAGFKGSSRRAAEVDDGFYSDDDTEDSEKSNRAYQPLPLPKPPAGFVVDEQGRVLMVSDKRIATIVDPTNNVPLECMIRRVFRSSQGDECMLLCPVDTPVQILKSTNFEGWSAVSDEEVEAILPTASYALAKINMHLVYSGFCYTARGGFCYTEDDIFECRTDDGQDLDGLPNEGVEITCFNLR